MKDYILAFFILVVICCFGLLFGLFLGLVGIFIKFLFSQNIVIGLISLMIIFAGLTKLIYCFIKNKDIDEKRDKNES